MLVIPSEGSCRTAKVPDGCTILGVFRSQEGTPLLRPLLCATVLTLLASTGCGGGGSSGTTQPPPPPQVSITVRPTSATVPICTIQPFVAFVSGAPGSSVNWAASTGTI